MTRRLYRVSGALGGPWTVALAAGVIVAGREVQRRWAADIWEAQATGVTVGDQRARGLLGDTERDKRLKEATAGI